MIERICPSCAEKNEIPEAYLGCEVVCPACKESYVAEKHPARPVPATQPLIPPQPTVTRSPDPSPTPSKPTGSGLVPALLALFIIIFVFVNRGAFSSPEKTKSGAVIWEYRVDRTYASNQFDSKETDDRWVDIKEEELNTQGESGWELVTCYLEMETDFKNFGSYSTHTGIKSNVRPSAVVAIFKRPKQTEEP